MAGVDVVDGLTEEMAWPALLAAGYGCGIGPAIGRE